MDVLVWQRCSNEYCAIIIFETLLIYIIIEHEATKILNIDLKEMVLFYQPIQKSLLWEEKILQNLKLKL